MRDAQSMQRDPVGVDGVPAGPHLKRKGYKKEKKAFESCLLNSKKIPGFRIRNA
jgi:hypothetical protein